MKTKLIPVILMAFVFMACNTTKKAKDDSAQNKENLIGPSWNLVKLDGKAFSNPDDMAEKVHFRMKADNKRVGGFAGCNTFMGSYVLNGDDGISFSPMASTRKACRGLKVTEPEILKVFEEAENFKLNADKLTLTDNAGKALAVFEKAEKATPKITEKYWKLTILEGQKVEMAENQDKEQYFILKNEGNRVKGFGGCNTFAGEFTLESDKKRLDLSKLASTMRACPDIDVDESGFLKALSKADNYTINGDTLELNIGRRAPLAVFEAVYFD